MAAFEVEANILDDDVFLHFLFIFLDLEVLHTH
jgi:hypothetical protein